MRNGVIYVAGSVPVDGSGTETASVVRRAAGRIVAAARLWRPCRGGVVATTAGPMVP
jgi:hypothetical protein